MRIQYDREADALSIICKETTVTTRDLSEGVTGEFDASGALVGIEVLDISRRFGDTSFLREVILQHVGPAA